MKILRSFSLLHFLPIVVVLSLAPHINNIPIPFIILNLFTISLFYIADLKLLNLPATLIKVILTFLAIILVPLNFGFHFTQNIATVLLSAMICLKLLEVKNYRDKRNIFIILFLGYFLVCTYFLNSQSLLISLYGLFLIFLITLNLAIYSRAPLTTIPIIPILSIIGKLALFAIPLTIILFLFFPRVPGPLWTLPSDDSSGTTGLSGEMYPGSVNNISESNEIAFRIDFDNIIPNANKLYWRGPVLTRTDGLSWQQSPIHDKPLGSSYKNIITNPNDYVSYTITLEPQKQPWVFTLEMPESLSSNFLKKPYLSKDLQYVVKHKISQVVQYRARSATSFYFAQHDPVEISLALRFPGGSNSKTFILGSKWKKEIKDKNRIIEKALDMFRYDDFYYTRTPPLMITNPADQFLFEAKQGFCEHYASSFVLLMRAAGIPARVVVGYQGMEYNKLGNYYVVRQSNAHAWAEVWLDDKGWTRIDPTAEIPQDHIDDSIFDYRSRDLEYLNINYSNLNQLSQKFLINNWQTISEWTNTINQYLDNLKYTWNNWLLGYDKKKQQLLMQFLGFNYRWKNMIFLMFGLLFFCFSLIFYFQILKKINKDDHEVISYKKLLNKLSKQGLTIHPHDGPEKIKNAAIKKFKHKESQINAIFNYYIHLRYGKSYQTFSNKDFRKMVARFNLKTS